MALAQAEKSSKRFYSLSSQILKNKSKYYAVLEKVQKCAGDITEWLIWFLSIYRASIKDSEIAIEKSLFIASFYKLHATTFLNGRQLKVIKKLLEHLPDDFSGGLTNQKYVSMTKTSAESAKRDLKDLVEKKILLLNEKKGRSTSYRLNKELL